MANVVVAFSNPRDAQNIKTILTKSGFRVIAACTSGTQALAHMEDLGDGIIVCGYRIKGMSFLEVAEDMPPDFSMLMVAPPGKWPIQKPENVVLLPMPLKVHDLVESMEMIREMQARRRKGRKRHPRQRDEQEKAVIHEAKRLLMERNGMTEEEAHRYIQRSSMDSGNSMVEMAQMVIRLIHI